MMFPVTHDENGTFLKLSHALHLSNNVISNVAKGKNFDDVAILADLKYLRDELISMINSNTRCINVLGQCVVNYEMKNGDFVVPTSSNLVNFRLPISPGVGAKFRIGGFGHGGWKIYQKDGQRIHIGDTVTTIGSCGSLYSSCGTDCVEFICVESGSTTAFLVVNMMGDLLAV